MEFDFTYFAVYCEYHGYPYCPLVHAIATLRHSSPGSLVLYWLHGSLGSLVSDGTLKDISYKTF